VLFFYPFFKKEKLKLFWLTGALLSVIPACMGMPSSRLLTFPCIGLSGLFSLLFKDFTQHWLGPQLKGQVFAKKLLSKFHDFSIRIVIPLLLILYLIISPLIIIMHYVDFKKGKEYRSGLANFGDKIVGEEKTIVVVKPPDTSVMVTGLFERAFTQKPVPEFVRFLCSGMQNLELYRIDKTSLLAKPEGGYTILPSTITDLATGKMKYFDDRYFSRWMETLYYNPQFPWKKGDIIRLTGLTISIKDVTEDGRILSALFEFEKPLESNTYEWIIWNSAASEYHPFPLPGIGGKIRI
jgi:hypothetical protein